MVRDIGWEFPSTNGGREDGLNDSGISYFQANPIKSLTREVIQDSLDARITEDIAVNVQFELHNLDKEAIPGIKDLIKIFNQAANYYEEGSTDTYEFFKNGHELLKKEKIPVLV